MVVRELHRFIAGVLLHLCKLNAVLSSQVVHDTKQESSRVKRKAG